MIIIYLFRYHIIIMRGVSMIIIAAERIKELRILNNFTQTELAARLNVTRSSVNAWEMGISIPSTAMLVELSQIFHTSTDYILGIDNTNIIDISHLSEQEKKLVYNLLDYFEMVLDKKR